MVCRKKWTIFVRFGMLLGMLLLTGTGCDAETPETIDAPRVTVFAPGQTEYAIVMEATGSDAVYHCADRLLRIPEEKPTQRNDRWEETPKEILIGETNRAVTASIKAELDALATEEAFHFVVAEQDGKILLLADHDLGYQYLEDYLPDTYLTDGVLSIPVGCRDIQTVTWEAYHASPYYAEILRKEEERLQREKEKEAEILQRKVEDMKKYAQLMTEFTTADFGERSVFPMGKYGAPAVYPSADHPRVLFTKNSIDTVRANLEHEENATAYKKYLEYSDSFVTGILPEVTDQTKHNMSYSTATIIESKAFRYAMTGDAYYGYQAIYAIKNMLLTLDIPKGSMGDACRAWGYVMYVAGCVYDWCYDLLTDECKTQIINGCVALMGPQMEMGVPPTKQGGVYGHGAEAQLLRDWLTIAIACYDEAPDLYDFIAGRILNEYVPAVDSLQVSGNHWEGSMYGPTRFICQLYAHTVFDRMTDGAFTAFSGNMREVMYTFIHYIRPDQQVLRIGDVWSQNTAGPFFLHHYGMAAFYAGNYYKDPVLRSFAYENLKKFSYYTTGEYALSPVMQLALNDPSVGMEDHKAIALSRATKDPLTSVFARTTWEKDDPDAAMVYMTMPKSYAPSHAHMDCGSFQIYYKGILASDTGVYGTSDAHYFGYNMQTVSANSILVYNPNLANSHEQAAKYYSWHAGFAYSGGQSNWAERLVMYDTVEELEKSPNQHQCTTLGAATADGEHGYQYAYLGGDMTAAYDPETVDEVTRYMLSATTDNADYPLVFVTFDRITADDASYRKSALIHMEEEPTITEDGFAIVTNTKRDNSGKLVIQTVMTDTEYTIIGGEGKRYWKYDSNADTDDSVVGDSLAEYGWGRIEISPAEANKTDHIMTVMYVTDARNEVAPVRAEDISTDVLGGAQLFGRAMLFPKNEKLLTTAATITLTEAAECYVSGVAAGSWAVTIGGETKTIDVKDGENLLTFSATAGTVTLVPQGMG